MKPLKGERDEARAYLLSQLRPGDPVYTILRHVSASGMMRRISPVIVVNGVPRDVSLYVERLLGLPASKDEGVKLQGCGMDMGFDLVYNMGRELWPDGTGEPHGTRNGEPDTDGGYALKQSWL